MVELKIVILVALMGALLLGMPRHYEPDLGRLKHDPEKCAAVFRKDHA
ncbi:hypothetical protein [Bradyrhizobium sp. USDA 329]